MCNTGHLHTTSLTCSEHRHHQNYIVNLKLHLAVASAKSVHEAKINLKNVNNTRNLFESVM